MGWLKEKLKQDVLDSIDLSSDISDQELLSIIDEVLLQKSRQNFISMQEKRRLRRDIFNSIRKLDILQDMIEDPNNYRNNGKRNKGYIYRAKWYYKNQ